MDSGRQGALTSTDLYVLDASVAIKWVLNGESLEAEANKLRDDLLSGSVEVCAPSLIMHEVANSLWKAIRQKRITPTDANEALKSFCQAQIDIQEVTLEQALRELEIAYQIGVTAYDATYLALNERNKATFVTADDQLFKRAKEHFRVVHLRDYV